MGLNVIPVPSKSVVEAMKRRGLPKSRNKAERSFWSHCLDAWVMASLVTGIEKVDCTALYHLTPLRFHRRQLHRLEPSRGRIRRRYGGTGSLGLKKGMLVKHVKYGLCYIGGNLRNRFSLHSLKTGERVTQNAKREVFKVLTRIAFRTQFIPPLVRGFLGRPCLQAYPTRGP